MNLPPSDRCVICGKDFNLTPFIPDVGPFIISSVEYRTVECDLCKNYSIRRYDGVVKYAEVIVDNKIRACFYYYDHKQCLLLRQMNYRDYTGLLPLPQMDWNNSEKILNKLRMLLLFS